MSNITARIRPVKNGKGLWLLVDKTGNKPSADDLPAPWQESGDVAYAITDDEVEAIRDACNNYLDKRKLKD